MGRSLLTQNKALETHLHQLLWVSLGVRLNQVQGPLYQLLPTQHQCLHMGRKALVMPAFRNRLLGGLQNFLSNCILLCIKKEGGRRSEFKSLLGHSPGVWPRARTPEPQSPHLCTELSPNTLRISECLWKL